jgi:hypothetical protein
MKIHISVSIVTLLSTALLCSALAAQSSVVQLYPQYRLTPKIPVMNDSVSFWFVKGMNGNSCVPRYLASFSIVQTSNMVCVRAPCPQDFTISLTYSVLPSPMGIACLAVMTEYGPRFNFGKLAVGNYTVVDSSDNKKTLMTFTVAEKSGVFGVRGTVTEDVGMLKMFVPVQGAKVYLKRPRSVTLPIYPPIILYDLLDSTTTGVTGAYAFKSALYDTITLGFVAQGYQSLDKPIIVPPDTVVNAALLPVNAISRVTGTVWEATPPKTIGCAPSPVGCVLGPVPGCTVTVQLPVLLLDKRKNTTATLPLMQYYRTISDKQGNYTIDSIPLTANRRVVRVLASAPGFVTQTKQDTLQVGTGPAVYFALTRSTAVLRDPTPLEKTGEQHPVISYMPNGKVVRLVIDRPQYISLSAYILNSRKVQQLSRKRYLAAGTYTIGLGSPKLSGGVIVFRVEGEGFSESVRINLAK